MVLLGLLLYDSTSSAGTSRLDCLRNRLITVYLLAKQPTNTIHNVDIGF